jgi:hypothetical protein
MRVLARDAITSSPDMSLTLKLQQHGWTGLLSTAILTSTAAAVKIEDADVVLVDMSCYAEEDTLRMHGDSNYIGLHDSVDVIAKLERTHAWTVKDGAGFVFMGPHPGTKLGGGACSLPNSYFLVSEPNQMCNIAQARANMTIAPYNAIAHAPTMKHILDTDRIHRVWFRGTCSSDASGRGLRLIFANSIAQSEYASNPEIIVACKGRNHSETMREMLASNFCLTIAGRGSSSRRINEIILAGCIPVFVGPPWHVRPLTNHIPWGNISLFFEIRNPSRWCPGGDATKDPWVLSSSRKQPLPEHATKYVVDNPIDVIRVLEAYSNEKIAEIRSHLIAQRPLMMFGGHEPGQMSLATLALMDDMCTYGKRLGMREAWRNEKTRLSGGYLLTPSR